MTDQTTAHDIAVEPDEIETQQVHQEQGVYDERGRLVRTVITTKDFLAGEGALDFLRRANGGGVITLGTLAGEITSVERKTKDYEGKELISYWLNGTFEAVIGATGEVYNAGQAILPRSYGVQVYNAFRDLGVTSILLGCTIGLKPSTRTIPYEWVVRDHMRPPARARVSAISAQLQRSLSGAVPLKQLT